MCNTLHYRQMLQVSSRLKTSVGLHSWCILGGGEKIPCRCRDSNPGGLACWQSQGFSRSGACFNVSYIEHKYVCILSLLFFKIATQMNAGHSGRARSKAWNIFARLNSGIVGSNPARGMDVCVYSVFALSCVSSGLATGWSLAQGVLPIVYV
jgi:hypothetical protein